MTQWSHRTKLPPEQQAIVERLQADRGVSEPVARNLLKCALLGVGPLVELGVAHRYVEALRPKNGEERAAAERGELPGDLLATKQQRMRRQEELLRLQEAQTERELQEEQRLREARRRPAPRPVIAGLQRLGPVLARTVEVDPLPAEPPSPSSEPPEEPAPEPAPRRRREEERGAEERCAEAKKKPKKRRRRAKELLDRALRGEAGRCSSSSRRRGRRRRSASRSRSRRSRSRSRSSEPAASRQGLMSEGDAKRKMQLEQKSERGSLRAQSRIQKELEEWEAAKRGHKEYWRPPRHRLCFQAETAKKKA